MVQVIHHRKVKLVHLDADDSIAEHCRPGDIAIVAAPDGWHLHFIAPDGGMESYDQPYPSKNEALWAAKAAAEYGFS
jgi:hypothetical protein